MPQTETSSSPTTSDLDIDADNWRVFSACATPDMFDAAVNCDRAYGLDRYDEEKADVYQAKIARAFVKEYCKSCPVKQFCLDDALKTEGPNFYGVRGGLMKSQLKAEYDANRVILCLVCDTAIENPDKNVVLCSEKCRAERHTIMQRRHLARMREKTLQESVVTPRQPAPNSRFSTLEGEFRPGALYRGR